MNLHILAKSLHGEVSGDKVLAPGPNHSIKDRSMAVMLDSNAPDGFLVHSFAGDDFRDCRDHVKQVIGGEIQYTPHQPTPTFTSTDKTEFARQIWQSACSPFGTKVEAYLRNRGLWLPHETSNAIRFHERCAFKGHKVPAMVCQMVDQITGEFSGIHRTQLNPKDKAMLGPAKGAVVKLTPDYMLNGGLHICEGIETGIAFLNYGFSPIWCTLSAGSMADFPLIDGIESLTIFADNDVSETGQRAAFNCGERWHKAGREVRLFSTPEVGTDFADLEA